MYIFNIPSLKIIGCSRFTLALKRIIWQFTAIQLLCDMYGIDDKSYFKGFSRKLNNFYKIRDRFFFNKDILNTQKLF